MIPLIVLLNAENSRWAEFFSKGADIATIFGGFGLFVAIINHIVSRKVYKSNILNHLLSQFRNNDHIPIPDDVVKLEKYIDLTNHQLYYISEGVIDKKLSCEWIEGMVFYAKEINKKKKLRKHIYQKRNIYMSYYRLFNLANSEKLLSPENYYNEFRKGWFARWLYKRLG